MKIEKEHKSRIKKNRLLPIRFFERLKDQYQTFSCEIDNKLEEDVRKVLLRLNRNDENFNDKMLIFQYHKKNHTKDYFKALSESHNYAQSSLYLSLLYYDEIKVHFLVNTKKNIVERDTYLHGLVFYMRLNLVNTFIHQFAMFDKLAQLLNIYFNLQIKENRVYFNELIRIIECDYFRYFKLLNIDTEYLVKLFEIKRHNENGIPIFSDSREIRDDLLHKINEISYSFFNVSIVEKHHDLAKKCLNLSVTAINNFYKLVLKNADVIQVLYKDI